MLKWSKKKPDKPGWYFYKGRSVSVVHVTWHGVDYRDGMSEEFLYCETCGHCIEDMRGQWAGPIEEPEGMTMREIASTDIDRIFGKAFACYGQNKQLDVLQEECAELITAIAHLKRFRPDAPAHFREELADVMIVASQFVWWLEKYGKGDEYWQKVNEKLERLEKRIEEHEHNQ